MSICLSSADVTINRQLYTSTGEIYESLSMKGVEYTNDISISPFIVYESADFAAHADGDSAIRSVINARSAEGGFGSSVESKGRGIKGSRTAATGMTNFISFDHEFATGELSSSSYCRSTRVEESAEIGNEHYSSSIIAAPAAVFHSGWGYGPLTGDNDVDFIPHSVDLWHNGKHVSQDLRIDFVRDEGLRPASYSWAVAAGGQSGGSGVSQIIVGTSAGNAQMDLNIFGTSSELPPKSVHRHIYPLMLDESIQSEGTGLFDDPDFNRMIDLLLRAGVSQNLYMSYSIK
ncbi:hypothetical protein [Methanothrix sp.]|uniref:hypothetical protein n=1 Tax=Methanothrix sp. TaxID=90426 RepID=UPI003C713638